MSDYNSMALGGQDSNTVLKAMQDVSKETVLELYAEKLSSNGEFQKNLEEIVNPFAAKLRQSRSDKNDQLKRVSKLLQKGERFDRLEIAKILKQRSDEYERRNPELKSKILLLLREKLKSEDNAEDILKKVMDFYPDVSLADEVLDFLLDTTEGDLHNEVLKAKNELNQAHSREILAGKNIGELSRQTEGLGTPTTLRDLYREITGSPREATTLFDELSKRYPFNQLKKVFKFLFHSLGSDMKSKGPSIARGQLHVLMQETRTLQAILGVYRFFAGRTKLLQKLFVKEGEKMPQRLNFESLSKQFMSICSERYPNAEKVLKTANELGISKSIIGKIIVYMQMRDAIRQVSAEQIFRSLEHRDELYAAIIEALEDLEDEWEDYLEQQEGNDDQENNKNQQEEANNVEDVRKEG